MTAADGLGAFLAADLAKRKEAMIQETEALGERAVMAPDLSLLYREEDGWRLSELLVPEHYWIPDPAGTLEAIGELFLSEIAEDQTIAEYANRTRPESWAGVAFASEAWVVRQDGGEFDPVLEAMARNRMLKNHPDRREALFITAILCDGTTCQAHLETESDEAGVTLAAPDNPIYPRLTGRVPDALKMIVKALGE